MSKKLMLLLFTLYILFCFSACGATKTISISINTPYESQTYANQNTNENAQTESESNETSTNPESSNEVGLDKLVVIDSSSNYYFDSNSFQDTYGNIYNGVHLFGYNYSGDSYAIYNLNREFKTFTGTIVASKQLENCAYVDYEIYVDDILVYSQSQLEKTTNKIDFNINVTGATKLTIKVNTYFKPNIVGNGYLGQGSIVNALLFK